MSSQELALHSLTENEYRGIIAKPTHAIGIYGVAGIGKTFVAEHLASDLLGVKYSKLNHQPYFRIWSPDEKGTIKLENALEIMAFMKLKTTGKKNIRRVIIIEHADCATNEAQNALLKTIEEPPIDTVIILTANSEQNLLSTISSRLRGLQVRKPKKSSLVRSKDQEKSYLLSMGLPGLFTAISSNESNHPVAAMIQASKNILSSDTFTRLTLIDVYSDRKDAVLLVECLGQVAKIGLNSAAKTGNTKSVQRWHSVLTHILFAQKNLNSSGSPKLVLSDLFLHM